MATTHASDGDPAAAAAAAAATTADDDDAFVRHASLAYAVPLATDDRFAQALEQCARTGGAPRPLLTRLPQRSSLFFDETADVFLIVRTPFLPADRLAAYGARLALTLDAHILNGAAPGRATGAGAAGPAPVVEVIYSGRIEAGEAPLVAVSDPEAAENEGGSDSDGDSDNDNDSDSHPKRHSYLIWKRPVFLRRPRARLHGPAVSFSATATLLPPVAAAAAAVIGTPPPPYADAAGYLCSRQPSGLNLLAAFVGDPALAAAQTNPWPRLSAQRVARVVPAGTGGIAGNRGDTTTNAAAAAAAAAADDSSSVAARRRRSARPLRVSQPPLALKIAPAVHTRVRFARANHGATAAPTDAAVVALLEVDFTPFFECEAVLSAISVDLPGGTVTDLNTAGVDSTEGGGGGGGGGLRLPLYCVARDHLTFLYRLAPDDNANDHDHNNANSRLPPASSSSSGPHAVAIELEARVLVRPGVCAPRLRLAWTAALDFAPPVNPAFGAALLPPAPLQRAHRPSQLSIDGMASFAAPAVTRPDALPSLEGGGDGTTATSVETTLPNFGITLTLTAPAQPVYAGEPFRWRVLVVNRAEATTATTAVATTPGRKLALLVLPKRRRNDVRVLRPPSASASASASGATTATAATADAVLDDNIVHAMQSSSLVDRTDVVCLSSADDTRIGPLAPGACHAATLRFVALRAGVVAIDAVRVVDLGSQEHVDVRALPVMVIAEGCRK